MPFAADRVARIAKGWVYAILLLLSALVWTDKACAQAIVFSPTSLPPGTVGLNYNHTVTATDSDGDDVTGTPDADDIFTYSLFAGTLPPGLTLNNFTGNVFGSPTTAGVYTFTLRASDQSSPANTGDQTYTVNIGGVSLTVNPPSLPNATQGVAYNQTVTASGGTGPYTFSVSSGALPAGLSLDPNSGAISGIPSGSGSSSFTIRAIDSQGNTGIRAYTVNVGTNSLSLNPPTLPAGTQGSPYSQTVTAAGGTSPYTYAVVAGTLPAGLSLNANTGAITGTPSGSGASGFTIQATDSSGNIGSRAYSISIGTSSSLTLNPASLPAGTQGTPYNQSVTASGGTAPYSYAVTAGTLPAGLSLNASTGAITGTPTGSGPSTFTIRASDVNGNTGNRSYTVNIGTSSLTLNPAILPNGSQGLAYSQTVIASGGAAPYTYAVSAGSLPAGLSLNSSTGAITGTPTGSGLSNFTIRALDPNGNTGSRPYSVNIGTNVLTVNPASLPNGTQGVSYSQTVTATGGTGPYTFSIAAGGLPAGLLLNPSTGAITGTPTASGPSNFTVRAIDANGNIGVRSYAVNVGTNSLTVSPASLPAAPQGTPYNQTVSASGGTAPYTFSIISGALPPGLSLNANTGAITGTPTIIAVFTFTIQARDPNGNIGSRVYTLNTARLNPAQDPNVQALVAAQAASSRRFADAQTINVTRHLESIHNDFDPCGMQVAIGISVYEPVPQDGLLIQRSDGLGPSMLLPTDPRPAPSVRECEKRWWAPAIAFWTGGTLQFGSAANNGLTTTNRFSTAGVASGVDFRVSDRLILGAALGYGTDRTTIGQDGTRSDATTFSGMLYASYRPWANWFVDGFLGYGTLGFDNARWIGLDATSVSGTRSGGSWFGSLAVGPEMKYGALKWAPYIRVDVMAARLNGYAEQGLTNQALTFAAANFSSTAAVLGLRGSYDIPTQWGSIAPMFRIDYKHALDGGFNQNMWYSDLGPGLTYTLTQGSATRNLVSTSVGLRAGIGAGATVEVEYGTTASWSAAPVQMLRGALRLAF